MDTEKFCPSFMEFRLCSYILLFSQSSSVINSLTFRRDCHPTRNTTNLNYNTNLNGRQSLDTGWFPQL